MPDYEFQLDLAGPLSLDINPAQPDEQASAKERVSKVKDWARNVRPSHFSLKAGEATKPIDISVPSGDSDPKPLSEFLNAEESEVDPAISAFRAYLRDNILSQTELTEEQKVEALNYLLTNLTQGSLLNPMSTALRNMLIQKGMQAKDDMNRRVEIEATPTGIKIRERGEISQVTKFPDSKGPMKVLTQVKSTKEKSSKEKENSESLMDYDVTFEFDFISLVNGQPRVSVAKSKVNYHNREVEQLFVDSLLIRRAPEQNKSPGFFQSFWRRDARPARTPSDDLTSVESVSSASSLPTTESMTDVSSAESRGSDVSLDSGDVEMSELDRDMERHVSQINRLQALRGSHNDSEIEQYIVNYQKKAVSSSLEDRARLMDDVDKDIGDFEQIYIQYRIGQQITELQSLAVNDKDMEMMSFITDYQAKADSCTIEELNQMDEVIKTLQSGINKDVRDKIDDFKKGSQRSGKPQKAKRIEDAYVNIPVKHRVQLASSSHEKVKDLKSALASHRHFFRGKNEHLNQKGEVDPDKAATSFRELKHKFQETTGQSSASEKAQDQQTDDDSRKLGR